MPRLVSFVIPTLMEDEIGRSLARLGEHLARVRGYDFELLLADDSPDSYKGLLDEAVAELTSRFARDRGSGPELTARRVDGPRRGKGAALKAGILASRGDFVFTMDADLPIPLENIDRFLRILDDEGADLVVAERPFNRNLSEPARFVASRVLYALVRLVVFQSATFDDTQCGFKAFRGSLLRGLAREQIVDGGMVDIEYLYAALRAGARARCVGVQPDPETRASKIDVRRAMMRDPIDLVRIKVRGFRGGYDAKPR